MPSRTTSFRTSARAGAQRHAYAQLMCAAVDRIGHHTIDAHRGQHRRVVLTFLKSEERDRMGFDKAFDGSDEVSGHGTPESRGSNGLAAMRAKEADHAAALLQAENIGIQVHAVDALDFEGDVML